MASTTSPARGATIGAPVPVSQGLPAIGVGIDTARYGHCVSFLRPDHQPAAKKLIVLENRAGYQALRERLEQLQQQHPQAHFHIRIDAAGQYANNLERFLRGLPLPMTLSIGERYHGKRGLTFIGTSFYSRSLCRDFLCIGSIMPT